MVTYVVKYQIKERTKTDVPTGIGDCEISQKVSVCIFCKII